MGKVLRDETFLLDNSFPYFMETEKAAVVGVGIVSTYVMVSSAIDMCRGYRELEGKLHREEAFSIDAAVEFAQAQVANLSDLNRLGRIAYYRERRLLNNYIAEHPPE